MGQQSLFESATINDTGTTLVAGFVFLRIDGVIASLAITAPTGSSRPAGPWTWMAASLRAREIADSVAIGLACTVAVHVSSVLGAGEGAR